MATLAKVELQDEYIVPVPFNYVTDNVIGDELIIVAVSEIPPNTQLLQEAYAFYGTENCTILNGLFPNCDEPKMCICVPSHCILDKACDLDSAPPPANISPLWTEDRFGISHSEAEMIGDNSQEMMESIHKKMQEFKKELVHLKIKTNKEAAKIISDCEEIIIKAHQEAEKTRAETRWKAAETVAQFIKSKFKVNAWVDVMVEPVVLFCVRAKHKDDDAVVIGCSVEGVINEIEPADFDQFFDDFIYDACVFPVVMDVSFYEGERITNKKDYYSASGGKS